VPNRRNKTDAGLKASPFAQSITDLRAKAAKLTVRSQKLARDMADLSALFAAEKADRDEADVRRHKP
jgi:hypothetical protein